MGTTRGITIRGIRGIMGRKIKTFAADGRGFTRIRKIFHNFCFGL